MFHDNRKALPSAGGAYAVHVSYATHMYPSSYEILSQCPAVPKTVHLPSPLPSKAPSVSQALSQWSSSPHVTLRAVQWHLPKIRILFSAIPQSHLCQIVSFSSDLVLKQFRPRLSPSENKNALQTCPLCEAQSPLPVEAVQIHSLPVQSLLCQAAPLGRESRLYR